VAKLRIIHKSGRVLDRAAKAPYSNGIQSKFSSLSSNQDFLEVTNVIGCST
jgi:hypothetical protein